MTGGKVLVHPLPHPLDWNKETEGLGLEQNLELHLDQSRESLKSDDLLDKDPVVNHLAFTTAGSVGLDLTTSNNQNKDSITGKNSDGSIPAGTTSPTTTLSTRKTYSLARARAPSPPHVITGFCSISKTPIKPSGEPSPQDFLGEADLPYPLPSTLHDRQTRQRKRAEQLRQLKIREDCEAEEKNNNSNRRRVFPSFRSPAWHQQRLSLNQHLKRCPSSPARGSSSVNNLHLVNRHSTCNIGQGSKEKALLSELATLPSPPPRRRVVFDLENIQVFEYDVSGDDWSPSSGPSSPTMPPASTNGRDSYVRYVPPSDCSSSGSSDEDSPSPRVPIRDLKSKA
ncbi:hypothetical protein EC991_001198 [Linnemannia zychae]|nr:hypothetical protein EC991_001198 [Linnemannia zychae]